MWLSPEGYDIPKCEDWEILWFQVKDIQNLPYKWWYEGKNSKDIGGIVIKFSTHTGSDSMSQVEHFKVIYPIYTSYLELQVYLQQNLDKYCCNSKYR